MTQKSGEKKATEGREELPERWSTQRKMEVVLRLLRGEDLGEVSREVKVPPPTLEEWRRVFLERGQQGLKARSRDPAERELIRTHWDRKAIPHDDDLCGMAGGPIDGLCGPE